MNVFDKWGIWVVALNSTNRFHKITENLLGYRFLNLYIQIQKWNTKKFETTYYDGYHHIKNYGFIGIYWHD